MTLEIIVTGEQEGLLTQMRFAELSVIDAPVLGLFASADENWGSYQQEISAHFTPVALADAYVETVHKVYDKFQDAMRYRLTSKKLFEALLSVDFLYASPKAYGLIIPHLLPRIKTEKEDDKKLSPLAHYDRKDNKYEVVVSLPENASIGMIKSYSIHEFGHHLHYLYDPQNHEASDPTIKEALAILLEEEEGKDIRFYANTPHGRAQQLLRKANEKKLKGKTFAEKWRILARFLKHEDLQDYIDGNLFLDELHRRDLHFRI